MAVIESAAVVGSVALNTALLGVIASLLGVIGVFFGAVLIQIRNEIRSHVEEDRKMFLEFSERITRLEP